MNHSGLCRERLGYFTIERFPLSQDVNSGSFVVESSQEDKKMPARQKGWGRLIGEGEMHAVSVIVYEYNPL